MSANKVEYRLLLPDGTIRHINEIVYPVVDGSGKVVERFGVVSDVTERKQAETEISRLAAIVSSSDDAIYSADTDGIIITWNPGAERLYGYTAKEIKGKHFTTLIPEDGRSEALAVRDRLFRGEAMVHYEFEHRRKDGSALQLSLTLSSIRIPRARSKEYRPSPTTLRNASGRRQRFVRASSVFGGSPRPTSLAFLWPRPTGSSPRPTRRF